MTSGRVGHDLFHAISLEWVHLENLNEMYVSFMESYLENYFLCDHIARACFDFHKQCILLY